MGTESGGTSDAIVAETNSSMKRARYYPSDFRGPYVVYIRALEGKSINRLSMWNMLFKNYKSVTEVKKIFSDKVRVIFSDIKEANSCVTDKDFAAFRVYIQANIVEVDGVVVMDHDENETVLEKGIGKLENAPEVEIKVLEVYRMKKKVVRDSVVSTLMENGPQTHLEKKVEWIPAKAVRVTFQGSVLPDFVKILGVVVQVHAFNPKMDSDEDHGTDNEYPELSSTGGKGHKIRKSKSSFDKARITQKEFHRRKLLEGTDEGDPGSTRDVIEEGKNKSNGKDGERVKRDKWNCNSVRPKLQDLLIVCNQLAIDIIALQETKLTPNSDLRLQGYSIVRKDRSGRGGGVLIAVKEDINYDRVSIEVNSGECVAVDVNVGRGKIRFFSVYSTNGNRLSSDDLNAISASAPGGKFVILGDFNAYSTLWGGESSNRWGQMIETWAEEHELTVLNDGRFTRVACPPNSCSAIDLSIVSSNLAVDCVWDLYENTLGSDHIPILLSVSTREGRGIAEDREDVGGDEFVQASPTKNVRKFFKFLLLLTHLLRHAIKLTVTEQYEIKLMPWNFRHSTAKVFSIREFTTSSPP
uniref:Endonuclease/exonuclease/phosphatase domain-containing protein n=1 Tax=Phlebotomus papatasi TaxID=29031 RepID=A0A1B0D7L8_PHLPP